MFLLASFESEAKRPVPYKWPGTGPRFDEDAFFSLFTGIDREGKGVPVSFTMTQRFASGYTCVFDNQTPFLILQLSFAFSSLLYATRQIYRKNITVQFCRTFANFEPREI